MNEAELVVRVADLSGKLVDALAEQTSIVQDLLKVLREYAASQEKAIKTIQEKYGVSDED